VGPPRRNRIHYSLQPLQPLQRMQDPIATDIFSDARVKCAHGDGFPVVKAETAEKSSTACRGARLCRES